MLRKDMKKVQTLKKTLTPVDKTSNMYRLSKNGYQNLSRNANTTTCKKAIKNTGTKINKKGIKFAKQADTLDKIEMNGTGNSLVSIKGHKFSYYKRPQGYRKAHKSI